MGATRADELRPGTLVWIDSREAVIVRWQGSRAGVERVESEVPAHHRATGHVRHDPTMRHGGGGSQQKAGEPHRLEHLERFVADVAGRLAPDEDLLVIGPGTVHERLSRHVGEHDRRRGSSRLIACQASTPLTDRQLIARLRQLIGAEPRRRSMGPYRRCHPSAHRAARRRAVARPGGL